MSKIEDVYDFIKKDFQKTLFPLKSTLVFAKFHHKDILTYIENEIFNFEGIKSVISSESYQTISAIDKNDLKKLNIHIQSFFMSQPWVYALKDSKHVRQTFLLDPICQLFLYDFVNKHRASFQKKEYLNRENYGYTFNGDMTESQSEEYKKFKDKMYELKRDYQYMGKIDISNFFNNIYHHDIVSYIARSINQNASEKFGKFLREINEGRSTRCMPQGLFPVKVIGSNFLSFVEESRELKSENIIRFMDDIYLFSDNSETIMNDIYFIQKLLGEKGLSLNEEKSMIIELNTEVLSSIESVKKNLLQKRRMIINSYDDDYVYEEIEELTNEEIQYLKSMLEDSKNIEDEDVELLLALLSADEQETIELSRESIS